MLDRAGMERSEDLLTDDEQTRERITEPRQALELIPAECWQLLRGVSVGRVVFTMNAMPAIRPVNHVIDGQAIIIRPHLGSAITGHASQDGAVVCYEVDEIAPDRHTGWSVIATRLARLVRDPDLAYRYEQALEPWQLPPWTRSSPSRRR